MAHGSDEFNSIGQHLDLTDLDAGGDEDGPSGRTSRGRLWVGVYYECCSTYARVYRRPDEMCYRGRCPDCGARVSIRVGPKGIAAKMLIATPI